MFFVGLLQCQWKVQKIQVKLNVNFKGCQRKKRNPRMSENSRKVIVKLTGKNQKGQLKNKISFSQHGMQFFIIFWNTCNHEMLLFKRNLFQCTLSLSRILSTKPVTNIWEIFWKIQTSPMCLQTSPIGLQTPPMSLHVNWRCLHTSCKTIATPSLFVCFQPVLLNFVST